MTMTTIKVPVELRDRLAERARRDNTTLAGAIASSLEAAETQQFWQQVRATMGTTAARTQLAAESETFASTLVDGQEPEGWNDIL